MAASVTRIMPVLYSLQITSTARTATTACPNWIPVRLSLVVSTGHCMLAGQWVAPTAAMLTATVSTTTTNSSQCGPETVRSLVHSACSASVKAAPRVRGSAQAPIRCGSSVVSLMRLAA